MGPDPLGLGGEVVDDLGRPGHLGLRLGEGLSHLAMHQVRQVVALGVHQGGVAGQGGGPLGGREGGPGGPGRIGLAHRPVGVLHARGRHLGQELPIAGGVDGQPVGRLEASPAGDQRAALGGGAQLFARTRPPLTRATSRMRQEGS